MYNNHVGFENDNNKKGTTLCGFHILLFSFVKNKKLETKK